MCRGLISYTLYDMFGPLVIAPLEVLENPTVEKPLARLSKEEMKELVALEKNEGASKLDNV